MDGPEGATSSAPFVRLCSRPTPSARIRGACRDTATRTSATLWPLSTHNMPERPSGQARALC